VPGPALYAVELSRTNAFICRTRAGWPISPWRFKRRRCHASMLASQHFRSSPLQLVREAAEVQLLGDRLNLIQHPLSHWVAIS
jgi:hypothetical protein